MNILCIGQVVYDITFPCPNGLIENQKYRIYNRLECIGAPAANAAFLCALWKENSTLIARVGTDFYGSEIVRQLKLANVNTEMMCIEKEEATSISAIVTNLENGNRTILNCPMKESKSVISFDNKSFDVILLDGHEKNISLQALSNFPNSISILDAGTYKKELNDLISQVDYLVCSQDFAYQYTKISIDINNSSSIYETFKILKQLNNNKIVITLGDLGVVYEEDEKVYHLPAFKTKVVDTTGAGDIFHGAFAYCLAHKYTLQDTIILASMTASISVESLGGQTSIPDLSTVINKLNTFPTEIAFKML